jgi:hypothetical protein
LDLNYIAELGWLARLAFPDDLRVRLEQAYLFLREPL